MRLPGSARTASILLFLGSAALATAGLEVAVRIAGLAPGLPQLHPYIRDDRLPYRRQPSSVHVVRFGDDEVEYRHNRSGFRDGEHERRKPAGVFRLVALGDSFTYGIGANAEQTYLAQLARKLNQSASRGVETEAINLGMPRYFPAAEKLALEYEGLAYAPDLVLVGILPNDVVDTRIGLAAIQVSERGNLISAQARDMGAAVEWAYLHSHLVRALLARAVRQSNEQETPTDADWAAMQADLEAMAALATRHGARFAVIGIPQSDYRRDDELDSRLTAWSARRGLVYISTWPAMRAADGGAPLYHDEGHCTPAGYAVIAQAVFDGLVAHGLVP